MLSEFMTFALGALINLLVAGVIVRFAYYPRSQNKPYVLTFVAFNTIIYFVLALLRSTDLGLGVGFGLFAVFSLLRYRTDPIPIREMTYLFVFIALPVVNSVLATDGAMLEVLVADGVVMALLLILEREWGFTYETSTRMIHDDVALIVPSRREELLADLRARTGLPVKRVEIVRLDYLRDAADLKVYYDRGVAPLYEQNAEHEGLEAPTSFDLNPPRS